MNGTMKVANPIFSAVHEVFHGSACAMPAAAKDAAAKVMAFETALAKASRKLEDLRDPEKNYNKMTPAELTAKSTRSIDWSARLAAWNLHPSCVLAGQPEFLAAEDRLLRETPLPVLKDYLRYHLVDGYAPFLSAAFDEEHFDFHGRAMSGQKRRALGDAAGPLHRWAFVIVYSRWLVARQPDCAPHTAKAVKP